jgi:hypothetical protein
MGSEYSSIKSPIDDREYYILNREDQGEKMFKLADMMARIRMKIEEVIEDKTDDLFFYESSKGSSYAEDKKYIHIDLKKHTYQILFYVMLHLVTLCQSSEKFDAYLEKAKQLKYY